MANLKLKRLFKKATRKSTVKSAQTYIGLIPSQLYMFEAVNKLTEAKLETDKKSRR